MLTITLTFNQLALIDLLTLTNGAIVTCTDPGHEGIYYVDPAGKFYQIGTVAPT